MYVSGANEPLLAPDASLTIFVLSSIPAGAGDGQRGTIELAAAAITGSGTPGTSFAGAGEGGGDAVVGATRAETDAAGSYAVSAATVTFVKSATVTDPFGGTSEVPGAVITYTLAATVNGSGSLSNLRVVDAIPPETTY